METTDQIYDLVGETEIEDKQYAAAAMKYSANTQGRCHISVQSRTEAEGCRFMVYQFLFRSDGKQKQNPI